MNRPGRRGYNLVELLVLMGTLSIALGLVVTLLPRVVRLERSAAQAQSRRAMLADFSARFRGDVHNAATAELIDAGQGVALATPSGQRVTYRWLATESANPVLERAAADPDDPQRMRWNVKGSGSAAFAMERLGPDRSLVVFSLEGSAQRTALSPDDTLRVEALLARDVMKLIATTAAPDDREPGEAP